MPNQYDLNDVVFESRWHWVLRVRGGYEIYKICATHSERCSQIGFPGEKGLEIAKLEIKLREQSEC